MSEELYHVVVNDEEQYSVWRADRDVPAGWRTVGEPAPKEACLDEIERVWTDMRPASVRRWMEESSR
ncbi:MbtH family NRPS accessory protein [Micromonospora sp. WMMD882]|uniref:MbtH family protein n=1 Tax=Micromonospora sp. WMMD882 TaxID=3015151 RepID=UPI00248BA567|nr:MbtH family NRPS accessory protein [Micromonospora sp. WMMD882]WBB78064.1 MbtH family NRPS accessory protein [Micromonospora sp. WMMD882]